MHLRVLAYLQHIREAQKLKETPTLRDIAEIAGVSHVAVHKALISLEDNGYIRKQWRNIIIIERE